MRQLIWPIAIAGAVAVCAIFAWSSMQGGRAESAEQRAVVETGGAGDKLAAGGMIAVDDAVGGDLAVAGQEVNVRAPVEGYVMAAGADVAIGAPVRDDVWAAGRSVVVSAPIGDSVRLAGADVILEPQAEVTGDALLAGNSVEVRAPVGGNLRIAGRHAVLASEVGGSVDARAETLELAPGAVIRGDLIAAGPTPPMIADGARVDGQVRFDMTEPSGRTLGGWLASWAFGFVALLAMGAMTTGPAPRWSTRVAERVRRFGTSLLAGFGSLVVVAVLVPLFAVTIVGMPLAIVLLALWIALVLVSGVFVALRLGEWVLDRLRPAATLPAQRFSALAVGALILSFVGTLPWVGWIAWIVVPLVGIGALMLERLEAAREPVVAL